MFEGGEVFRPERSLLVRSGRALVADLVAGLRPGVPLEGREPNEGPVGAAALEGLEGIA
jgi:hypothetical protein